MKNQIIICFAVLFLIGIVSSIPSIPHIPHAFYGNVYYSDGTTLIEDGYIITAIIGDFEISAEIINGKYDLMVESNGGTIEFYISGQTEPIETFTFEFGQVTELNLTTNLTNTNNSSENNSSSSSSSSTSSKRGSSGGSGPSGSSTDDIINLNYKTSSLEGIGSIKTNESSEKISSGITGSVINFIGSGKVAITFISLIGILIAFIAVKKLRKKN